jgi:hypothetical protein
MEGLRISQPSSHGRWSAWLSLQAPERVRARDVPYALQRQQRVPSQRLRLRSRMRICITTTDSQKCAGDDVESDPAVEQRVAVVDQASHPPVTGYSSTALAGNRKSGGRGSRHACDLVRIAAQMRNQHEEGDTGAGAEQHRRADHVNGLEEKIRYQRSSRTAVATRFSTSTGQILSVGPSGSAQSRGTRCQSRHTNAAAKQAGAPSRAAPTVNIHSEADLFCGLARRSAACGQGGIVGAFRN